MATQIHTTSEVSAQATVGNETRIWNHVQIRENVTIGAHCILGKGVYVDFGVTIGDRSKIQNGAQLFHAAVIEEEVFIGPNVVLTNDRVPRAANTDGSPKTDENWSAENTTIKKGASVGACAVILPGRTIGRYAMIGAGSVVTRDIPDFALAVGNPARVIGSVCKCGQTLDSNAIAGSHCGTCPTQSGLPNLKSA